MRKIPNEPARTFPAGAVIVVRYWRADMLREARPCRVVEDNERGLLVWLAAGAAKATLGSSSGGHSEAGAGAQRRQSPAAARGSTRGGLAHGRPDLARRRHSAVVPAGPAGLLGLVVLRCWPLRRLVRQP